MSKKDVSAVVSGAGFISGFWTNLDKEVRKRGGSDEAIYEALKDGSPLVPKFAELIVETSRPKFPSYKLTVDYDRSVEEAVKAGKYGWVNDSITSKNFPTNRNGTVETEIILFHPNRYIESEEVIRELDKLGLRPAELKELLALGESQPDLQRQFPIVAFGSLWQSPDGDLSVPELWSRSVRRDLDLDWFDCGWGDDDRFVAVRK